MKRILILTVFLVSFSIAGEENPLLGPGALPPPPRSGGLSLVEALWKRHSCREFSEKQVDRKQLGFLLWAASGINRTDKKLRTIPSAWEAYPVSIYVTSRSGTMIYDAEKHALEPAKGFAEKDLRAEIPRAAYTKTAPVVLVLVADYSKFERSRPESRKRYSNAEAGAIAQNLYLAAAARGLGTVMTADIRPELKDILKLGENQEALYVLPVGYPKG